jgi:hypothetical protein
VLASRSTAGPMRSSPGLLCFMWLMGIKDYSPSTLRQVRNVCRQKVPDTFWSETMDGLRVSCGCDSSPLCLRL